MANALAEWLNSFNGNPSRLDLSQINALLGDNAWQYQQGGDDGQMGYTLTPEALAKLQGYTMDQTGESGDMTQYGVADPSGASVGQVASPIDPDSWFDKFSYSGGPIAMMVGAGALNGAFGGAAGGSGGVGQGAWLGEGLASGVPAWDAAALGAEGLSATLPASAMTANEALLQGGVDQILGSGTGWGEAAGKAATAGGGLFGGDGSSWIPGLKNGTALSIGGNLLSGLIGSNAAGKAADAQLAAGRESNALAKYMYDTTRSDYAPYRQAGTTALGQIQSLLADPSAITKQPDYQFGFDQGSKALDHSAASRGNLYSGAQLKATQKFGQDYAGTKLNESYNRLAGIAGIGQQATGSTSQAGQNYANNAGQTMQGMGNAQGSAYMGQANALAGGIGGAINSWQQQMLLEQLLKGG